MSTDYVIRSADVLRDLPSINILLEKYFHPEETLLKCLLSRQKPTTTELCQIEADQRRVISAMIVNFPCLVAVYTPRNEIVGVNVMISSENPDHVVHRSVDVYEAYAPRSALLVDYYRRMNGMIDEAELFVKFPKVRRALEFYAVAVNDGHRRKGLATRLMQRGLEMAEDDGVDLVFGLFTSPHSKRSAVKIGMLDVEVIDLLKYRDQAGVPVFKESVPHNFASVMAVEIRK